MQVEIWSDVVCPWCYIGKRRFETALAAFEHRDEVEVTWHSFELDRNAPSERLGSYAELLGRKYGMGPTQANTALANMTEAAADEGLEFHFESVRPGNTFDAHRLLHLADAKGVQHEMKERLLRAYFTEGEAIGDRSVLRRLGIDVGLDGNEVDAMFGGDDHADEVRADEAAAEELQISGVPFFVIDRRFAVSGAQAPEAFTRALERAWGEQAGVEGVRPPAGARAGTTG